VSEMCLIFWRYSSSPLPLTFPLQLSGSVE
jgi:hypothetical protein